MRNPGLLVLTPILPEDIGPRAIQALEKFTKHDLSHRNVEEILANAKEGNTAIFIWNTLVGLGVIVCSVIGRGDKRELYLDIICGSGYFKIAELLQQDLMRLARSNGCETIGAVSGRQGLVRFMIEKLGWQARGTYGNVKVQNG